MNDYLLKTNILQRSQYLKMKTLKKLIRGVSTHKIGRVKKTQRRSKFNSTFTSKFKSKSKPPMQDSGGNRLPDDVKIFGGDLIRVAGSAKAYNVGPQKGVTLYLNNVRLVEKRATGSDDFGGPEDGFVVGQSGSEEEVF